MTHAEAMTHAEIEDEQVAERYLLGKLSAEEIAWFEEHYLSCAECLDRLEAAEGLARGFKRAAANDLAQVTAARQLLAAGWLARLGRQRQAALLLSVLLVALAAPGIALYRGGRLAGQLRDARAALAAAGSRQRAEQEASRRALVHEQQERAALASELAQAREPQADVPVLYLGAERGTGGEGGATYRLRLPQRPSTVVLSLPIEPSPGRSWRVVLTRAGGVEIWRSGVLALRQDTLAVAFPSRLLAPGDHVLAVESVAPAGRGISATRFTFRVLPPLPD